MKIMDTERIVCPKCKVELNVPIYQCDETKKYGMKYCHQCGTKLILNPEDEEVIRSVREGTKAMYNYTEEQVSVYWQGVEDFCLYIRNIISYFQGVVRQIEKET